MTVLEYNNRYQATDNFVDDIVFEKNYDDSQSIMTIAWVTTAGALKIRRIDIAEPAIGPEQTVAITYDKGWVSGIWKISDSLTIITYADVNTGVTCYGKFVIVSHSAGNVNISSVSTPQTFETAASNCSIGNIVPVPHSNGIILFYTLTRADAMYGGLNAFVISSISSGGGTIGSRNHLSSNFVGPTSSAPGDYVDVNAIIDVVEIDTDVWFVAGSNTGDLAPRIATVTGASPSTAYSGTLTLSNEYHEQSQRALVNIGGGKVGFFWSGTPSANQVTQNCTALETSSPYSSVTENSKTTYLTLSDDDIATSPPKAAILASSRIRVTYYQGIDNGTTNNGNLVSSHLIYNSGTDEFVLDENNNGIGYAYGYIIEDGPVHVGWDVSVFYSSLWTGTGTPEVSGGVARFKNYAGTVDGKILVIQPATKVKVFYGSGTPTLTYTLPIAVVMPGGLARNSEDDILAVGRGTEGITDEAESVWRSTDTNYDDFEDISDIKPGNMIVDLDYT